MRGQVRKWEQRSSVGAWIVAGEHNEGRDGDEGRCTRVSRKERQGFAKVAEVFKIGLGDHSNAGPKSSALILDSTSCRIVLSGAGRRSAWARGLWRASTQ
jgi:hypothetical protein